MDTVLRSYLTVGIAFEFWFAVVLAVASPRAIRETYGESRLPVTASWLLWMTLSWSLLWPLAILAVIMAYARK